MKTPNEKAKQIIDKIQNECVGMEIYWAKQCALLCVCEIITELESLEYEGIQPLDKIDYWQEVERKITQMQV